MRCVHSRSFKRGHARWRWPLFVFLVLLDAPLEAFLDVAPPPGMPQSRLTRLPALLLRLPRLASNAIGVKRTARPAYN